jgi:hypothetical protein
MRARRSEPAAGRVRLASRCFGLWGVLLCLFLCIAGPAPSGAVELVSVAEAALPDDWTGVERGLTRGPEIRFMSPSPDAGLMKSPLDLKIRFRAHGGTSIDPDSVLVTYMKSPPIDVTQRVLRFIQRDGIDLADAQLPPGTHRFRVDVTDSDGRRRTSFIVIRIQQ